MGYKKCPACDINWILDDAEVCEVCRGKKEQANQNYFSKPEVKHLGRNIFWVFQGQEFLKELYFQPEDSFKQLVYEDECGRVVAYVEVMFFLERKTLEIANFIVDREYQLQGYGRKSYNELEKLARKIGIKKYFYVLLEKGQEFFGRKWALQVKKHL